jgi:hypothetical protein
MEEVIKWLNSDRDYKKGALLYNIYGNNVRLKALFLKSETLYNKEKLVKEFKELTKNHKPVRGEVYDVVKAMERGEINPYNFPVITPSEASSSDDLWELYKDLEVERNKLSNQYHALINQKAPKEEFARHYQKIEEKSKEMLQVWDRIHNRKGGTDSEDDIEGLKLEKRRIIDQRSKVKKKLENFIKYPEGCAKRILMEKEVAVLSAKFQKVQEKLKMK